MSLPPDPHEDDLTDPAPAAPGATPAPPPPPPPPAAPAGAPAPELGTAPSPSAASGPAPAAAPPPPPAAPAPGEPTAAPTLAEPPRPGGRNRVLVAVAAAVALVAIVGGAVVLAGGDDGDEEPGAPTTAESSADDAGAGSDPDDATGPGPADEGTDDEAAPAGAASPDTPEATVEALFAAFRAGDCQGVVDLMAPEAFGPDEAPADVVADCQVDESGRAAIAGIEIVDITPVSESGDDAVVSVTATLDGETSTQELPLRRVDGDWKVASLD